MYRVRLETSLIRGSRGLHARPVLERENDPNPEQLMKQLVWKLNTNTPTISFTFSVLDRSNRTWLSDITAAVRRVWTPTYTAFVIPLWKTGVAFMPPYRCGDAYFLHIGCGCSCYLHDATESGLGAAASDAFVTSWRTATPSAFMTNAPTVKG